MQLFRQIGLIGGLLLATLLGCVDALDLNLAGKVDLLVVDGTITNLNEPQIIRINRSRADPKTGRFGTTPLTKATVQVVVNSSQVIDAPETLDGNYQLPDGFKGQVGQRYELRIRLPDGTQYQSTAQVMPDVPAVTRVEVEFNSQTLPADQYGGFRAGHEFYIDTQDPADAHNYYRWDWVLYEKQEYCQTCVQGVYSVTKIIPRMYMYNRYYVAGDELYEDCFTPTFYGDYGEPEVDKSDYRYDYYCRTQCWEIIRNHNLDLFDDLYSNGGFMRKRLVARIPFYTHAPAVVAIRQLSLTADAYRFFKLFQDQTQNTGGLADTPPTALVGNISQVGTNQSNVVGYFTASAVSEIRHWLDRKDTEGPSMGFTNPEGTPQSAGDELFYALNGRSPNPEPTPPYLGPRPVPKILIWGGPPRVPTAMCIPNDSRTPFKPEGWRD